MGSVEQQPTSTATVDGREAANAAEWRSLVEPGRFSAVHGANFSGRTSLLQALAGVHPVRVLAPLASDGRPSAYVRPEVEFSISTFRPTAREEVLYHLGSNPRREAIFHLLETAGLSGLLEQNPTMLSGGEQAMLVFLSKLALNPRVLAMDCALEQVGPALKAKLLSEVKQGEFSEVSLLLADNRFSEDNLPMDRSIHLPNLSLWNNAPEPKLALSPIDPAVQLALQITPCSLELCDLSFAYERKRPVLRGVNARFEPGKLYVIRGRNGAGKSTLAKLLSGVLPSSRGQIKCNGETVVPYREPGRLVGYHFQNPDVQFVARAVEEDVTAGPAARGVKGNALTDRVDSVLAAFGLKNLRAMDILDLPFVLRKRLALASMMAAATPWMVFDEPALGQDDESCRRLAKIFSALAALGAGVIVISHAGRFVEHLDTDRLVLENGHLTSVPTH